MADGEDILYRPVLEGLLDPLALADGRASLGLVMRLNEAIDVRNENQHRRAKAEAARAKLKHRGRLPPMLR